MVMEQDCSCTVFIKESEYQYGQADRVASEPESGLETELGSRLESGLTCVRVSLVLFGPWSRPGSG